MINRVLVFFIGIIELTLAVLSRNSITNPKQDAISDPFEIDGCVYRAVRTRINRYRDQHIQFHFERKVDTGWVTTNITAAADTVLRGRVKTGYSSVRYYPEELNCNLGELVVRVCKNVVVVCSQDIFMLFTCSGITRDGMTYRTDNSGAVLTTLKQIPATNEVVAVTVSNWSQIDIVTAFIIGGVGHEGECRMFSTSITRDENIVKPTRHQSDHADVLYHHNRMYFLIKTTSDKYHFVYVDKYNRPADSQIIRSAFKFKNVVVVRDKTSITSYCDGEIVNKLSLKPNRPEDWDLKIHSDMVMLSCVVSFTDKVWWCIETDNTLTYAIRSVDGFVWSDAR